MKTFSARRARSITILLLLCLVLVVVDWVLRAALLPAHYYWGWGLLTAVLILAAYNPRKRLSFLPLAKSATWLQFHIYIGFLSMLLFGMHTSWKMPHGILDWLLAGLYIAVASSGVIGLVMSRMFANLLTTRGEEVLYERIPIRLKRLQEEVQTIVLDCASQPETTAVPDFYFNRLHSFFERPRHLLRHVLQSDRPVNTLLFAMAEYDRYLNDQERVQMKAIAERVRIKSNLDYQFALQSMLKYWLFVHVPLTYGLLVVAAFHVLLAHAYSGGAGEQSLHTTFLQR